MKSMTGFGMGTCALGKHLVIVEIFAVNHRYLEVKMQLPRGLRPLEAELRTLIQSDVHRGRLDVAFSLPPSSNTSYSVIPNVALAHAYRDAATELLSSLGLNNPLDDSFFTSRSDLFDVSSRREALSATEVKSAKQALRRAIKALQQERSREGRFLQRDLRQRIANLKTLRKFISTRTRLTQKNSRQKLMKKVTSLLPDMRTEVDRVIRDVAILVQKSDITEELVRLSSHLDTFSKFLNEREPVGKRMDFLLQEMHREVNTIGAKADDAGIRQSVVEAKEEVEKLREQVQNIE